MKPQSREILQLLERHPEGITQQDAIRDAACYRLAARVADLKADGYRIASALETDGRGNRYARYRLVVEPVQAALW